MELRQSTVKIISSSMGLEFLPVPWDWTEIVGQQSLWYLLHDKRFLWNSRKGGTCMLYYSVYLIFGTVHGTTKQDHTHIIAFELQTTTQHTHMFHISVSIWHRTVYIENYLGLFQAICPLTSMVGVARRSPKHRPILHTWISVYNERHMCKTSD